MTHHAPPVQRVLRRGIATAVALLALAGSLASAADGARTVRVDDTGYLRLAHASGEELSEAGAISGTLPGTASVHLHVGAETVTASFTIDVRGGGSISGTGLAKIGSPGRYTSFAGTLAVTGGTGRFAHAHGQGKLYGVIERKSDKLTVQTREGALDY